MDVYLLYGMVLKVKITRKKKINYNSSYILYLDSTRGKLLYKMMPKK